MRTNSNQTLTRGALSSLASLAIFCTGVSAQEQQAESTPVVSEAVVTETAVSEAAVTEAQQVVDQDSGETLPAWERELHLPELQDFEGGEDYTIDGMFMRSHGQYMQDYKRFEPNFDLRFGYQGKAGLSSETGSFSFAELGLDKQFSLPVDPDMFLIYGARFNMRDMDFTADVAVPDMRLYKTFLEMGMGRFISEDFLLELRFQPGLATDFGGTLTSDDWKWFGDIIGTYRTQESLYWKFGVRVDETFEETPAYLVLGVSWLISPEVRLDILAPRYAELAWMPSPSFILKGGLDLQGQDYLYRDSRGGNGVQRYNARTQEFRIYIDGAWRLDDMLSFSARVGGTLAGKYDFQNFSGTDWAGQVDPVLFGELMFGVNF